MNIGPFTGSKNFLATASVSLKNLEHATCNYFCFAGFYGSNMLLEILVAVLCDFILMFFPNASPGSHCISFKYRLAEP